MFINTRAGISDVQSMPGNYFGEDILLDQKQKKT